MASIGRLCIVIRLQQYKGAPDQRPGTNAADVDNGLGVDATYEIASVIETFIRIAWSTEKLVGVTMLSVYMRAVIASWSSFAVTVKPENE